MIRSNAHSLGKWEGVELPSEDAADESWAFTIGPSPRLFEPIAENIPPLQPLVAECADVVEAVPDEFVRDTHDVAPLSEVDTVVDRSHDEFFPAALHQGLPADPPLCLSLSTVINEETRSQIDRSA